MGSIASSGATLTAAGVTYEDVVTVKDSNPLDTCAKEEEKLYAPGVGEAGDTVKKLVSFTRGK